MNLEDLEALTGISASTLSRFERRKLALDDKKVDLILLKLGIKREDVPSMLESMKINEAIDFFAFRSVEAQIKLDALSLRQFNHKLAYINQEIAKRYLRGKRFFVRGDYENATKQYQMVINTDEENLWANANLIPTAYVDMAVIAYKRNDHKSALNHLDKATESFNVEGERLHTWHAIHYNQALIHFELGYIDQAEICLEPVWVDLSRIVGLTKIKVYELKASIKRKRKLYNEAIAILYEALEIASIQDSADGIYYVLVDLGKLAFEMKYYLQSERCFRSALDIQDRLRKTTPDTAYIEISNLFLFQNKIKDAKKHIKKAIQGSQKSKDIHDLIQAYITEGNICEKEGNKLDSCSSYKKALELANDYQYDIYKPILYEHIFRCTN